MGRRDQCSLQGISHREECESFAVSHSWKADVQVVYDTTDAAIVLFTAVGTEVRHNEIFSKTRVMLGGQ